MKTAQKALLILATTALYVLSGCSSTKQQATKTVCPKGEGAVEKICKTARFDELLKSGRPGIVKFSATWCPPCMMMAPLFENAAQKYGKQAYFAEVDVDILTLQPITQKYVALGIPTFIFFNKQGKIVTSKSGGFAEDALNALVEQTIKS